MKNLEHDKQTTETTLTEEKGVIIDQLRKRAEMAFDKGYYMETIYISSILLEERLFSTNSKFISTYPSNKEDSRNTLGMLIGDFIRVRAGDAGLHRHYITELVNDIEWFLEFRNKVTHALMSDTLVNDNNDLRDLAEFTFKTAEAFRAATRRWKNREF